MPAAYPALRDAEARNALVLANLPLTTFCVKRAWYRADVQALGRQEAQDIATDALIRAAELWEEGRQRFSTYAVNCIRWQLIGHAQKKRQGPKLIHLSVLSSRPDNMIEERYSAAEEPDSDEALDVRAAMAMLTERQRDVLTGIYWDGKGLVQIGQEIGVSHQRTHEIHYTGLKRLRELLTGATA